MRFEARCETAAAPSLAGEHAVLEYTDDESEDEV